MKRVLCFFAEGYEEVEAITVVDLLKRADIEVITVSVIDTVFVKGSHNIVIKCDQLINDIDLGADMIFLPGGMPGTTNLEKSEVLIDVIKEYNSKGKYIAAICAAPSILGGLGILKNKNATCYPGNENKLIGANKMEDKVVVCDNVITGEALGSAIDFSLKLIELLLNKETAISVKEKIIYQI